MIAIEKIALLQEFFGECIVGHGLWPPRLPDLTLPNLFFCGNFSEKVYLNNP
jgi:hypothetical protein